MSEYRSKYNTIFQPYIEKNGKSFDVGKVFSELLKNFPAWQASLLGYIGARGKDDLKKMYLSGQEIDLDKYPYDKSGRRTVSYSIGKKAAYVLINSYPLNLFEHGRMLRSGVREPGKKILTGKFKGYIQGQLSAIGNEFSEKILQKEIDKVMK